MEGECITDFILRPAEERDRLSLRPLEEELFLLHKNAAPHLFTDDPPHFTEEYFRAMLADPDRSIAVAETKGGEIAGFINSFVRKVRNHPILRDQDLYHVEDLCVLERFRGNRIGKALMEQAERDAKARGCLLLELGVYAFNRNAVEFYRSLGMEFQTYRMQKFL